jgi:tRNA threonylcarbamoyladenosine biosynthesis protein TsaB
VLLLGLDTATETVCAAVLETSTDQVLARVVRTGPTAHGELLAPVVAEALVQAGISPSGLGAIGVGRGPGPFTGLRVGLVHAEVLGLALGISVHGVVTLDAIAAQARAGGQLGDFLVVTDARRREVYWARYNPGGRIAGPEVCAPGLVPHSDLPAVGAGAARYPEEFPQHCSPTEPDPVWIARLAARHIETGEPADRTPMYLRRPDATPSLQRKKVTPR